MFSNLFSRSTNVCLVTPRPAGAIMYWRLRALTGWRRRLREAEPLASDVSLMVLPPNSMNGRQSLVDRGRARRRHLGIAHPGRFDRAVRQPNQVEGLGVVPRREPVRGLGDDRNGILKAGILPGIGFEIGREQAQLFGDDVADEIVRGL